MQRRDLMFCCSEGGLALPSWRTACQFAGRLHICKSIPGPRNERNPHTGLKGEIGKDIHCSIYCARWEVEITCVSVTGGKINVVMHTWRTHAALEDLKSSAR